MELEVKSNPYELEDEIPTPESFQYKSTHFHKTQDSAVLSKICLICIQVALLFSSVILIGMTAVILVHLKTQPVYDSSTPITSPTVNTTTTTGGLTGELNCNTDSILNQTLDTARKVDELYDFINMRSASAENDTRNIKDILNITGDSAQKLINIVSTLSNLEATSVSTSAVVDDILVVVNKLLELQNGSVLFNSIRPVSCKDILDVHPGSPSGYYHVNSRNIYCNMGELCGSGGGWTRLAYLDMTDATQNCPPGFRLYQTGGVRACGRPVGGASIVSVNLPSNGISWSQVCGRVVGYQFASPDAVDTRFISLANHNNINSFYADGVSITRGSPRQHVWTLMAGVRDSSYDAGNCPCSTPPGATQSLQSFIGNHYFCESGNPNNGWSAILYTADPLWDGQGCGTQESVCCSAPGLPWFHRDYGNTTTSDNLELRLMADEHTNVDDIPISFYEIYVK